jgi:hypothetical protein
VTRQSDAKLLRNRTRVRRDADAVVIEVERWWVEGYPGMCLPVLRWFEAARLPANASARAVAQARRELLEDPQWFTTCATCGARWVNGDGAQRGCACE